MAPDIRAGLVRGLWLTLSLSLVGCSHRKVGDDIDAMRLAVANGPRSSPFDPPEENDHTFVVDASSGLDTGCTFRSGGPLQFDVDVTRFVGELNPDGTLKDAAALVAAGLLSDKITLIMPGFDVDSGAAVSPPDQPERDRVLFNGEEVGFLGGENNQWKLNEFHVDISKVKFPARGAVGSAPAPAKNHITIQIDTANADELWCTAVDWASLSFKAMSPIVLVHGNNSNGGFFQRQGFTGELARRHLAFDNSISMTTDSVAVHAKELDAKIPAIVKSFGVDSVHLVAHSKGGLDSREYLALHQPAHDQDFKVLSYTTLSTPHNGSVLADLLVQRDAAVAGAAELEFENFPRFTETIVTKVTTDPGTVNLTTGFAAGLNGRTAGVSPDTVFLTVSADADTNGDAAINRSPDEYLELRQESATLQTLDDSFAGHTKSRIAVDTTYQILRRTASVGLRFETRKRLFGSPRTVAILTAAPNPTPLGNDVLVTLPSGQGVGSVASRVKHSQVYTGAAGRNHSSVANAGVASDMAPHIVDVEKAIGDLK
jgi:triacylglycerol lipase